MKRFFKNFKGYEKIGIITNTVGIAALVISLYGSNKVAVFFWLVFIVLFITYIIKFIKDG